MPRQNETKTWEEKLEMDQELQELPELLCRIRQNETKTREQKLQGVQELQKLQKILGRVRNSNSDQPQEQEQTHPVLQAIINNCENGIEELQDWVKVWIRILEFQVPEFEEGNTERDKIQSKVLWMLQRWPVSGTKWELRYDYLHWNFDRQPRNPMPGRSWLAGDPYYRWEDELLPRPECRTCQNQGVPDGSCQQCVERTALETFEEMLVETHNDLCQRIADNQATFNAWLDSDDIGFFHITGGPGSGKSFLMFSLHNEGNEEHLRAGWFRGTYGSWIRLFFYPFTEKPRELNFLTMIRGLLFALIKEYPKLAQALFPKVASQATTPEPAMIHNHEVFDAWDELVAAGLPYDEDKIFLTIDGLNKLDPADHPRMIQALKDWVQARPHNVKICISSRGEKAFQEAFESYPGYNIDGVNLVDMLWYARDEPLLQKAFPRINKLVSPDEPYKLEYSMAKMADGSMLYLLKLVRGLIWEESRSCGSIEEIIDALTKRMLRYRGNYDSDMLNSPQLEY